MKFVTGVPTNRQYQVVCHRRKPTKLQSEKIIVAAFNDRDRAEVEAEKRNQTARTDKRGFALESFYVM